MKLTKEKLFPYLPYNLKIIWNNTKEIYTIFFENETDWQTNQYPLATIMFSIDERLQNLGFKLILHPLADLTKEKLSILFGLHENDISDFEFIISDDNDWYLEYRLFGVGHLSSCIAGWNQIQILLSKHYDLFGLIKEGLAVDINTLTK